MTTGIISALGRQIETSNDHHIHGVIQTSAPMNPGNSGGPLLDSAGRLIGMNTAILSPSGAFAGIGFAIPVDEINHIVPQLIRNGKIVRPHLGVQVAEDEMSRRLGVDQGVLIVKVLPGSSAAKAHLQGTRRDDAGNIRLGDVVTAVDGKPVGNADELNSVFEQDKVGDTVKLTIVRDGKQMEVPVTLGGS
jgi:S1-C subfamily serine protease